LYKLLPFDGTLLLETSAAGTRLYRSLKPSVGRLSLRHFVTLITRQSIVLESCSNFQDSVSILVAMHKNKVLGFVFLWVTL